MDLNSVMGHVDFANPVSWIGLWGAILATAEIDSFSSAGSTRPAWIRRNAQ